MLGFLCLFLLVAYGALPPPNLHATLQLHAQCAPSAEPCCTIGNRTSKQRRRKKRKHWNCQQHT